MKSDKDFSIITVNSENDDEIVIQVGVREKSTEQDTPEIASTFSSESGEPFPSGKAKEEYQRVTEADLDDAGPYNKMRLIIIMCGFLLLVGFIVYFLFLR